MRTNYILIDFENVQPASMAGLDADHFRVIVFVGASQNKISLDSAAALQRLGSRAEYVKIAGNGCNALDFHIAFHIGRLCSKDPKACFHIISKDKGFDPLLVHLKELKIHAKRSDAIADIPVQNAVAATSLQNAAAPKTTDKVAAVVKNLRQRGTSKPSTVKTLTNTIKTLFQNQLTEEELASILKKLQSQGTITVNDSKVTYAKPSSKGKCKSPAKGNPK